MVNGFLCIGYTNFTGHTVNCILDWDCDKVAELLTQKKWEWMKGNIPRCFLESWVLCSSSVNIILPHLSPKKQKRNMSGGHSQKADQGTGNGSYKARPKDLDFFFFSLEKRSLIHYLIKNTKILVKNLLRSPLKNEHLLATVKRKVTQQPGLGGWAFPGLLTLTG